MRFPWSRSDRVGDATGHAAPHAAAGEEHSCPSLSKVLDKVLRRDKPQILDLGPFCGATAVYLADRGAKVSVAELQPPPAVVASEPDDDEEPPPPIRIDEPDGRFDLVLVWEVVDFIPPERLREFAAELDRLLSDDGWALLLSLPKPPPKDPTTRRPPRYRVVADDRVLREASPGPPARRYGHPTREIERSLSPLGIQGIHLQRSQMREFLMAKRGG